MFIFYSNFGLPPNNDTKNFIFGLQESAKATMCTYYDFVF